MERVWVTTASPTVQAVVNPVTAACEQGFVPTTVHLVRNPSVEAAADEALTTIEVIVEAYGESLTIHTERLADERDFNDIAEYYRDAVTEAPADSDVAIDLTPGQVHAGDGVPGGPAVRRRPHSLFLHSRLEALRPALPGGAADRGRPDGFQGGNRMTLSRRGLMLVLNALWTEGVERVTVEHPCAEIETQLEVDLDGAEESTVRIRAGRQSYKSRRETVHLHHGDHAYEDLPDAHTLPGTHRGRSGQRVQHRRDRLVLGAIHPPGFGGRTSAGIDANIFPWRVPAVLGIDQQRPEYDDQRPPINGYALSSGVESELDWQFKQRHTQQIAGAFGPEFERLEDQPAGSRRARFLGSAAFRRLRANRRSEVIKIAEGYEPIVEGYREWAESGRKNVVGFILSAVTSRNDSAPRGTELRHWLTADSISNDRGFVNRATDAGVPAVRVEYPVGTPRAVTATWDEIRDTLCVLAVVFGVLKLPKLTLYAVWEHKTGRHWRAQEVDAVARLERDQSVLDAYDT